MFVLLNALHSSQIVMELSCKIPLIGMHLQAELKTVCILISWLLGSQLFWIYTVFKTEYSINMLRVTPVKIVKIKKKVFDVLTQIHHYDNK